MYQLTGHRLSVSYSAAKIMWLRDNVPSVYGQTRKFVHAKDYVVARLTGEIHTDYSDASGMNRPVQKLNFIEEATSVGAASAGGVGVGLIPASRMRGDSYGSRRSRCRTPGISRGTEASTRSSGKVTRG